MDDLSLLEKIKKLPPDKKLEVEDFAEFLLSKGEKSIEKKTPQFGFAKGAFKILPGFDDSIEGLEEYM